MHIFKDTHFDFLKWRWHAIALSWIIIIAGAVVFLTKGIPLGIEFAGGTAVIVKFEQPTSVQQVADTSFGGGVMPQKSTDFYPKLLSGMVMYKLRRISAALTG